jgi:hypothetical protein
VLVFDSYAGSKVTRVDLHSFVDSGRRTDSLTRRRESAVFRNALQRA